MSETKHELRPLPCGCEVSCGGVSWCPKHAAAAEMYAALKEMIEAQVCGPCALCDKARAALAKAEGGV